MKLRLHILSTLCAMTTLGMFQACGVDPLDAASMGPPTKGQEGYTKCQDPAIPDTDKDGVNDECEALIGPGPIDDPDCNNNGVPDALDGLGPNCQPLTDACPPAGSPAGLTCDEYNKELEGQKNKNLNKLQDGALLAASGLNAKAPNGTKVTVQSQFIRVVYNHTSGSTNSGLQTANSVLSLCGGTTFIFYKVEGEVAFCSGHDASSTTCGDPKHAVMELCGPIQLFSNNPGEAVITDNFKWTKGWIQGEKYTGEFDPGILTKKKEPGDNVKLTLTPSTEVNGVLTKMDVKFDSTFRINGELYGQEETIFVNTPKTISTLRKFKRGAPDVVNSATTPFMVGPWRAGN